MSARPVDDTADIPRPERDWERGESPPSATKARLAITEMAGFFIPVFPFVLDFLSLFYSVLV